MHVGYILYLNSYVVIIVKLKAFFLLFLLLPHLFLLSSALAVTLNCFVCKIVFELAFAVAKVKKILYRLCILRVYKI